MDIADVARRTGIPASTLRYYEKRGLIRSLASPGQRRQFAADITDRLALIALGQSAGFSLDEVEEMLGQSKIDRQRLVDKASELEARARRLMALGKGLRHAAECPAEEHLACPTFQRLLKASTGATRTKKRRPCVGAVGRP
ncbi:helix-turn-helix domain-containing protein [Pseudomonas capeferrum]|uniref:helix-turn-helix domain-containing protein n=1 Tax=Pseudomonas capeferrum TaxID=1495066 RepID=UPI0015E34C8D|nr:helix-turn-helix domain-containing protein [Pseudomonas capeferrum]MBA1200926.1 helix-turn-helix domain-containing protein [Pseudomonas capeferrum]